VVIFIDIFGYLMDKNGRQIKKFVDASTTFVTTSTKITSQASPSRRCKPLLRDVLT
jgi:hypothetical protein